MFPRLGEVIRRRRDALGMGQGELADLVGVNQPYISALENNRKKFPEQYMIRKLAQALECRASDILREIGYVEESEGNDHLNGVELYTHMMDLVDRAQVPDHVKDAIRGTIRSARIIESERLNSKGTSPNTTE